MNEQKNMVLEGVCPAASCHRKGYIQIDIYAFKQDIPTLKRKALEKMTAELKNAHDHGHHDKPQQK